MVGGTPDPTSAYEPRIPRRVALTGALALLARLATLTTGTLVPSAALANTAPCPEEKRCEPWSGLGLRGRFATLRS